MPCLTRLITKQAVPLRSKKRNLFHVQSEHSSKTSNYQSTASSFVDIVLSFILQWIKRTSWNYALSFNLFVMIFGIINCKPYLSEPRETITTGLCCCFTGLSQPSDGLLWSVLHCHKDGYNDQYLQRLIGKVEPLTGSNLHSSRFWPVSGILAVICSVILQSLISASSLSPRRQTTDACFMGGR